MANKMLIDASHPEETRVVVLRGQRVEEFDFESATRKQLRGNIYLAKVTRVEPSLQAAFVEYGGNRHGFLPFSEIHPDYYQIPVADRQALIEEDARAEREFDRQEERRRSRSERGRDRGRPARAARDETVAVRSEEPEEAAEDGDAALAGDDPGGVGPVSGREGGENGSPEDAGPSAFAGDAEADASASVAMAAGEDVSSGQDFAPAEAALVEASPEADEDAEAVPAPEGEEALPGLDANDEAAAEEEPVIQQVGGTDALEEIPERPRASRRQYKIQEVIKRRQVILVQVVKEERGTKGAALTTYLSIAGRYSVLMPNTGRGGGISRKITSAADRKRLREIAQELEVPEGMGVILRTAGASRTKAEIKRDFEYLMRLWESVRELTLQSTAPALVYEEGSLVKRAIRDLYNKDIDEVLVAGDDAYREAKDFMRMLIPSHAKIVQPYKDSQPLFARYGIEAQLDAMFSNHVPLRSGGYLVINPTEALVSIDVNSGRATREHNIEDTALKTNLEAAEEIARQLRLRDLAGLIVIDFIDMEEKRNNRAVEKRLDDNLKHDRARIQVGRISPFGLLEMSRQRIRTGVLESSSIACPHCGGAGFVRATPSVALNILRSLEESLIRSASHNLAVRTRTEVALYVLNSKRAHLRDLELRFGVTIVVMADDTLGGSTMFAVDRTDPAVRSEPRIAAPVARMEAAPEDEDEAFEGEDEADELAAEEAGEGEAGTDESRRRRRRRRRRGRGPESREGAEPALQAAEEDDEGEGEPAGDGTVRPEAEFDRAPSRGEDRDGRRRRRGRRGGRGRERDGSEGPRDRVRHEPDESDRTDRGDVAAWTEPAPALAEPQLEGAPEARLDEAAPVPAVGNGPLPSEPGPAAEALRTGPAEQAAAEPALPGEPEPEPVAVVLTPPDPERPKRAGWWSKAKAALGS